MTRLPRILNSLTGEKQALRFPSLPFSWYICGPTVYDHAHLGHARTYVCFDIIRRVLNQCFGLNSTLAMGLTDIDDKILSRAKTSRLSPSSIAERFEASFMESMATLGVQSPDHILRVTEHIDVIVAFIRRLYERGFAYITSSGDVVFDTKRFHTTAGHSYGKLQPANFAASGSADFALWKAGGDGDHAWPSPWGPGRPGWHIECSAMASSVFGERLDVHGGGIDLKFPHHNNELAQCEACFGSDWTQHWWHTGHLHIDGLKMSKSLKNFITVDELMKEVRPDVFRMFCLLHRYRSSVHYTSDRMKEAGKVLGVFKQFAERISLLTNRTNLRPTPSSLQLNLDVNEARNLIIETLADDFDTAAAITVLLRLVKKAHVYMDEAGDYAANRPVLTNLAIFVESQLTMFGLGLNPIRQLHEKSAVQLLVDFR